MWVRKTEKEIAANASKRNWSPLLPLALGVLLGVMAFLWQSTIDVFLFASAIGFIVIYLYRVIFGDRFLFDFFLSLANGPSPILDQESYLCPQCQHPQLFRRDGCRICGAPLEEMSRWKWVRASRKKNA
jgi:hypothetical protein